MAQVHDPIEEEIRQRARALWEEDGRPEGRSNYYWYMARRQIDAADAEDGDEIVEVPIREEAPKPH